MSTTTGSSVIPGVVAMSAREVKALRDRITELEAALGEIERWTVGMEDELLDHIYRTARAALQQGER